MYKNGLIWSSFRPVCSALRSRRERIAASRCGSNFQGGVSVHADKRGKLRPDIPNPCFLSGHCSHTYKLCYLKQCCESGNNGSTSHLCSCPHTLNTHKLTQKLTHLQTNTYRTTRTGKAVSKHTHKHTHVHVNVRARISLAFFQRNVSIEENNLIKHHTFCCR